MHKMIQIRHVPNQIHSRLKARAALANTSLSEYLLNELRHLAERPTRQEMVERLEQRQPVKTKISPADAVRAERDQP
jgi:plasmid stability protein